MVSISSLAAIFSLAIALCGIIPLFPWLEPIPRSSVILGLAAGLWQSRTGSWPLKNWMFNAAIVPVFLFYAVQFSRADPVRPVVSVLAIMLAVRLAGPSSSRHYLQSAALSLFCLASSSLFDLSLVFLVYLALMLFLVAMQLVLLAFYSQDSGMALAPAGLRRVLAAGMLMPLASLPLMALFFPLLPRTQMPLWNFLAAPAARSSGLSDTVEPGKSPDLSDSRVPAFRAEMPRQPQQRLYWRTTVFNRAERNRWVRAGVPTEELVYAGPRISQTIYPEPGSSRTLPALDAPAFTSQPRSRRSYDGIFERQTQSGRRLAYTAESQPSGIIAVRGSINRSFYLKLPEDLSPRIHNLGIAVRSQASSDSGRLERIETYFRNGGFRYSRHGLPTGERALETFLFETRQGHCEFFASSFALLLRSAGIPARVVGGYLGGDYSELGGYYLVSEDMAHVWVEAFLEGKGWVRIDPSGYAQNADAVWSVARQPGLKRRVRLLLDSLDHSWNRTVITYDFERQADAVRLAGGRLQNLHAAGFLKSMIPYLIGIALFSALWMVRARRHTLFTSREERLLNRFYRQVERDCNITVERGRVGLFELAALTGNPAAREFADIYGGAVYRDRRLTDDEYARLKNILVRI